MKLLLNFLFPRHYLCPGIFGSLVSAGASLLGGVMANDARRSNANADRDFQRENAQSAHQWQVADMRAAGLNPILSATGGSGARASGGSMAGAEDPITPAVNSALAARRQSTELDVMKATEANTEKDTEKKDSEIKLNNEGIFTQRATQYNLSAQSNAHIENARKIIADHDLAREQTLTQKMIQDRERAQANLMREQAGLTSHSARSAKVEADIDSHDAGKAMKWIDRATGSAKGATSAVRSAVIPDINVGTRRTRR